jgi:hypothetical protein
MACEKANVGCLREVLAYMIEGQYEASSLEDYRVYVLHYRSMLRSPAQASRREHLLSCLRHTLKCVLNNPQIHCDEIFADVTDFGFGDEATARLLFEMIWDELFPGTDWHDRTHINPTLELVDEPYG